jgi:nitronate monooxygenase
MIKTRITELLGIRYPILMGAMYRLTSAEMVSAVAEAGGLGFIPSASFTSPEDVRAEIRKVRAMTNKPIGLNISLVPAVNPGLEGIQALVAVGIEEQVSAFETAGASPASFIDQIKKAGIPVLHKVTQLKHAKSAEAMGADAVIVIGFEGGGYLGSTEIATMILVNSVARSLSIPVIAAGGVVDGCGLTAALALGAEGVLMGTRFIASTEAFLHRKIQEWMIRTGETDTEVLLRSFKSPVRFISNKVTRTIASMEKEGSSMQEMLGIIGPAQKKDIHFDDDTENRLFPVGLGVSMIDHIKPIAEIIQDIVRDAETAMNRLDRMRGVKAK